MPEPVTTPGGVQAPGILRPWPARATALVGGLAMVAAAASALAWSKWLPYAGKLAHVWSTHTWTGKDLLGKAGAAGSGPSVAGAAQFAWAYTEAIWKALVAALLIAAAVDALMPRALLRGDARGGGGFRGSLIGGVASLPSLMCTCCTSPVAITLRRSGASRSTVLAYWVGNPVLNPAVIAFLALVGPWQWAATRVLVGCVLVFGVSALVARVAGGREEVGTGGDVEARPSEPARAPARFARTLVRLTGTLLPEYVLVLFLLGLFRGWLLPLGAGAAHLGLVAAAVAVVLGTLVAIPTGGEIPIVLGLALAGVGPVAIGALLITLPAISLLSMALVIRTFSARLTLGMAAGVAACGALAGALLWALPG